MAKKEVPEKPIQISEVEGLQAVLDAKIDDIQLKTDLTDNSDNYIPSQKTVKSEFNSRLICTQETVSRTITIPYTYTAVEIQTEINNIGKYIPQGVVITLQFTNTSAKYFANAAVVDKGSGKVGLPCNAHGFSVGATIEIDGTTNYNGSFVVDADSSTNEIVITASYIAETLLTTAIARIPTIFSGGISLRGFFGGGQIVLRGNTSETSATVLHTTQQVIFDNSANSGHVIACYSNNVIVSVYNIKIKLKDAASIAGIFNSYSKPMAIRYNYIHAAGQTALNYGINISFSSADIRSCYFTNMQNAIALTDINDLVDGGLVKSVGNDDYGTKPKYGLYTNSGIIMKAGTQPTGATADESKVNGGQIFA